MGGLARWPENRQKMSGFVGVLLERKELHVSETAQLSDFGFPSLKHPLC